MASYKGLFAIGFATFLKTVLSISDNSSSLTFFLLGDWGKGGASGSFWNRDEEEIRAERDHIGLSASQKSLYQKDIASAMDTYANTVAQPSFVVTLGDNFYSNGVSSYKDAS